MRWSDIPLRPSTRTLRQFACLWIGFFALFAGQALWRDRHTTAVVFAVLAITIGPLGLFRPQTIRPIFVAWMVVAFPIGWAVSHVMLGIVFYALFTPLGFVFRLIGRNALLRRPQRVNSYWQPKPVSTDVRSYFRQF